MRNGSVEPFPTVGCRRVERFEMNVRDVFVFGDGRTVLVGDIANGPSYIPECDCELFVDDTLVTKLRIEGEIMPLKRTPNDLRSVSTFAPIDVSLVRRDNGQCRLRSI